MTKGLEANYSPTSAQAAPAAAAAPAAQAPAQQAPAFRYQAPNMPNVNGALNWTPGSNQMSGAQANERINQTYHAMDQQMTNYLHPFGQNGIPEHANFATRAKVASRNVGTGIQGVENVMSAQNGSAVGAFQSARAMTDPKMREQAAMMGTNALAGQAAQVNPVDAALNPAGTAGQVAGGAAGQVLGDMAATRDALVRGNVGIYNNIGGSMNTFLQGESDRPGGGMAALREAGLTPGSKQDPDGNLTRAFEGYQQARQAAVDYQNATTPEARQAALDRRNQILERADQSVMMHEQSHILQNPQIMEQPGFQRNMRSVAGSMEFHDANGTHQLLPANRDYTNFQDRTGSVQVPAGTPGSFPVTLNGQTNHYTLDANQPGSIAQIFRDSASGPAAQNLMRTPPSTLFAPPTTATGRGGLQTAQGIDNGNAGQVAGGLVNTGSGAVSDVSRATAPVLRDVGRSQTNSGVNNIIQGSRQGGLMGNLQAAQGAAQVAVGQTAQNLSQTVQTAGLVADVAGPIIANRVERSVGLAQTAAQTGYGVARSLAPQWLQGWLP